MIYEKVKIKIPKVYYTIIRKCECGGVFKPTGISIALYPPQTEYKCDKCGKIEYERD